MQVVGAFTFAGAFPSGASEVGEEAAFEIELGVGQLAGASAGSSTWDIRRDSGYEMYGVVESLRRKATRFGVREIRFIFLVPFIRRDGELIGARIANFLDDLTRVEFAFDESLREIIEELRIGRRIAGANIVERFDDSSSEQVTPKAVGVAGSKILVVRARDPRCEFFTAFAS